MNCKCSYPTDEFHGWGCKITGVECMFLFPDSKACAEKFNEGPDAVPCLPFGLARLRKKAQHLIEK